MDSCALDETDDFIDTLSAINEMVRRATTLTSRREDHRHEDSLDRHRFGARRLSTWWRLANTAKSPSGRSCRASSCLVFTANLEPALIGMEACSGSHFLGRALSQQGHDVRLIPAQLVKPFVKSNKNDFLDAEAIAEAVERQNMRFVPYQDGRPARSAGASPRTGAVGLATHGGDQSDPSLPAGAGCHLSQGATDSRPKQRSLLQARLDADGDENRNTPSRVKKTIA